MSKSRGKPRVIKLSVEKFDKRAREHDPWQRLEVVEAPSFLRGLPQEKILGLFVSGSSGSPRTEVVPGLEGDRSVLWSWDVIRHDPNDFPDELNNETYKIVEASGSSQYLLVGPVLPKNHHTSELDEEFLKHVKAIIYPADE